MLRFLSVAALLVGTIAARLKKEGGAARNMIDGIPVFRTSSASGRSLKEKTWVAVLKKGTQTKLIEKVCASTLACGLIGSPSEGGFSFLTVEATESKLATVIGLLKNIGVTYLEEDQEIELDPEFESALESSSWGLDRVGVPSAANKGKGVNVYIMDTGIRTTHADFGDRATSAFAVGLFGLKECRSKEGCAADGQGHGTHCAGTVGGATYGVAPGVNLFAGKVLSDSGAGSLSWSYKALDYAATKAARPTVASMSLGGPKLLGFSMKRAVNAAVEAGVVVVVAGGNSNTEACSFSPAFIPSAITVGSTDSTDTRSSFSNYGSCTDIWAPGSKITSAGHSADDGILTASGTSMACPHVSGGAALVLEQSPELDSEEVLEILLRKATKDAISDLQDGDTNAMLWVGDGPAGRQA